MAVINLKYPNNQEVILGEVFWLEPGKEYTIDLRRENSELWEDLKNLGWQWCKNEEEKAECLWPTGRYNEKPRFVLSGRILKILQNTDAYWGAWQLYIDELERTIGKDQLIKSLEYLLNDWEIEDFKKEDIIKKYKGYIQEIEKGNKVI